MFGRCLSVAGKISAARVSGPKFGAGNLARAFSDRQSGKVKFFDAVKGFGFITTDAAEDIFVHQTSIQTQGFRSLAEGEDVEFLIGEKEGKRFAQEVTGPGGAPPKGAPRKSANFDGGEQRERKPRRNRSF
jgi:protein lin-28